MTPEKAANAPVRVGKTRLISMEDLDRRTKAAQMALETKNAIMADLGGADRLYTMERLMAEHAAPSRSSCHSGRLRPLKGQDVPLAELPCFC